MNEAKSWQYQIDFQCRFGAWPFQKTLNISPNGFEWCGELIPLKDITRLRWGVDLRRGGIFPRRVYIAVFGNAEREYVIKTKDKDFYGHLVERYWKAVGRRLLTELLDGLAESKTYVFDSVTLEDMGITIYEKNIFGRAKSNFYEWSSLSWGIVNGCLSFAERGASDRLLAGFSLLWSDNAQLLNTALNLLPQSSDTTKLSKIPRDF